MSQDKSNLEGLKVLLGISGGVAAYKAVDLASKLRGAKATVKTIMTESACELVRPKSFEAVTGQAVFTSLWSGPEQYRMGHINLVEWADIVVVAPATADIIGKVANGICDDLLSTTLCVCWQKPVLVAPTMNSNMWANPAVQRNVEAIKQMEFKTVGPETGRLACGIEGAGRMSEPADIIKVIDKMAGELKNQ